MANDSRDGDGDGGGVDVRASYLPQRHVREMQQVHGRAQRGEARDGDGGCCALLVIDLQNYTCHKDGALFSATNRGTPSGSSLPQSSLCDQQQQSNGRYEYFWQRLQEDTIPKLQLLLQKCREKTGEEGGSRSRRRVEVIYTVIECLTRDCRDNSADYKVSGLAVPKGCWDAQVLEQLSPSSDDIVIPKTSCNVFVSTNIDYVLRCLGVNHLIVTGGLTDQCVETCVRTCCDLGYRCTVVEDCCVTHTRERHERALDNMKGFCRIRSAEEVLEELSRNQ